MHYPFLVRGLQRVGDLVSRWQRLFQRHSAVFDPVGQRGSLHQLHDQVAATDIVNLADVGVI